MLVELLVMEAHEDEGVALGADEVVDLGVVITFVLAAEDEDGRCGHGLEGIPAGVDIGRFGVVDETDAADGSDILESVLDALEGFERLADDVFANTDDVRGNRRRHGVQDVMATLERQFVFADRQRVGTRETIGIEGGTEVETLQLAVDDGVFRPVDEGIIGGLVAGDAELGVDIVLELKVIAVQMIRRDIQQDGDVGLEVIHVIELERGELDDIIVVVLARDLEGQRVTDIAREADIESGIAEDIIDERSSSGLTVRTGDTDHLGVGIARGEFDLGDDRRMLRPEFLDEGRGEGYTGGLDDFIGVEDEGLGMVAVFPCDGVLVEEGTIRITDRAAIGDKDVKTFGFG